MLLSILITLSAWLWFKLRMNDVDSDRIIWNPTDFNCFHSNFSASLNNNVITSNIRVMILQKYCKYCGMQWRCVDDVDMRKIANTRLTWFAQCWHFIFLFLFSVSLEVSYACERLFVLRPTNIRMKCLLLIAELINCHSLHS